MDSVLLSLDMSGRATTEAHAGTLDTRGRLQGTLTGLDGTLARLADGVAEDETGAATRVNAVLERLHALTERAQVPEADRSVHSFVLDLTPGEPVRLNGKPVEAGLPRPLTIGPDNGPANGPDKGKD